MPDPQQPGLPDDKSAISAAGAGAATDMAMSEGISLEDRTRRAAGPTPSPAPCGRTPGATCAATRSS